jgi:hypothetical protein
MRERGSNRRQGRVPTALLVVAAPLLGLLFVVILPIFGLATIALGLARPAGTAARPAGGPASGHQEPRSPRPMAGTGR